MKPMTKLFILIPGSLFIATLVLLYVWANHEEPKEKKINIPKIENVQVEKIPVGPEAIKEEPAIKGELLVEKEEEITKFVYLVQNTTPEDIALMTDPSMVNIEIIDATGESVYSIPSQNKEYTQVIMESGEKIRFVFPFNLSPGHYKVTANLREASGPAASVELSHVEK